MSERATIELATPRKDASTLRSLVQQKLDSGQCRLFGYGERVYLVSAKGTERTAVRRVGDRTTYWLPASWTRPANECEANASSASLQAKLGLPNTALPTRDAIAAPSRDDAAVNSGYAYRNDVPDRGNHAPGNDRSDRRDRAYRNDADDPGDDAPPPHAVDRSDYAYPYHEADRGEYAYRNRYPDRGDYADRDRDSGATNTAGAPAKPIAATTRLRAIAILPTMMRMRVMRMNVTIMTRAPGAFRLRFRYTCRCRRRPTRTCRRAVRNPASSSRS